MSVSFVYQLAVGATHVGGLVLFIAILGFLLKDTSNDLAAAAVIITLFPVMCYVVCLVAHFLQQLSNHTLSFGLAITYVLAYATMRHHYYNNA